MKGKSIDHWIDEYSKSHQNGFNRVCHTIGIPMIMVSLILMPLGFFSRVVMIMGVTLFVLGWVMQFAGHAVEGKPPEFFKDWRFLLIGTRWWWKKIRGKV